VWLVGTGHGTLARYSRAGVEELLRGPDPGMAFADASGELEDLAVVVGERPGAPPALCALAAGRWLKPLPLPSVASVTSLARLDDARWLVTGRLLEVPPVRALLAAAGRPERGIAIAVGGQGAVVRVDGQGVTSRILDGQPDLAAAAVDALDREWAASVGAVWLSPLEGSQWMRVWSDPTWRAPFTSLMADVGLFAAMTADGGVVECRWPAFEPTQMAGTPGSIAPPGSMPPPLGSGHPPAGSGYPPAGSIPPPR
jgi:hypothetical protein